MQTGTGFKFELPNYLGELYTADEENTPILNMLGGLTNGGMMTQNFKFPVTSEYDLEDAQQPTISEEDATSAPDGTHVVRQQEDNVTQIHQRAIDLTYEKLSNANRLSGINTANSADGVDDELAWQIDKNLIVMARNVEYSILRGEYNGTAGHDEQRTTRGISAVTELAGGTVIDAGTAELDKDTMQELFREMFGNGALFLEPVIVTGAFQKQKLSDIYGYAPESREIGGVNIQQIETDFGNIGILPPHRFMEASELLVVEMDVVRPVFQPVPNKGVWFYEELGKEGAAEKGQLYGKFGLDHGPSFAHGKVENLTTS